MAARMILAVVLVPKTIDKQFGRQLPPMTAMITAVMMIAFNSRDETITHGFDFCEDHFDVHRFHPPLVYGRRGDCEVGEGICLIRGKSNEDEQVVHMLLCYELPIVSARAIPQAIEFFSTYGKIKKLEKLKK